MSAVLEKEENKKSVENTESPKDLTDAVTGLLETLVPPTNIEIIDVFGNDYKLSSSVSARKQIKILREFDKLKEISTDDLSLAEGNVSGIVSLIVDVAMNEVVFDVVCNCFFIAHPKTVAKAKAHAENEDVEFEENHLAVGDLFPIEEIVSGIVHLFIRLARRTGKALAVLSN